MIPLLFYSFARELVLLGSGQLFLLKGQVSPFNSPQQ